MSEIFRILKPGNGWAQCGEVSGCCFENDIIPSDAVLPQVCDFRFCINLSFSIIALRYFDREVRLIKASMMPYSCSRMLDLLTSRSRKS